ncbi:MAG: hypothetical protein JST84_13125 [Acidobacteria bacterium]|nr:hypothetical protein [Acidobacteriota bacterium]
MVEFVIVAEDRSDAAIARDLADRVFYEDGPAWMRETDLGWFNENILPGLRMWDGLESGTEFTRWDKLKDLSKRFPKLKFLVSPVGKGKKYDYGPARRAIQLAALLRSEAKESIPDAIVLIRDLDSQEERRQSLMDARDHEKTSMKVVLATPNCKYEAWVLNGFYPADEREKSELERVVQELGFDLCSQAERLRFSSGTSCSERNPKEIVSCLTNDDYDREKQCWLETSLAILRQRGENTYLRHYLDEVQERLLPLLLQ